MKKLSISMLVITLLISLSGCSKSISNTTVSNESNYTQSGGTSPQEKQVFYGEWTIKSPLAHAPVTAMGGTGINQLLGKKLFYSSDLVSFAGDVLKNPYYQLQDISIDDFQSLYRVNFEALGISDNYITEIHVYPTKDFTNEWFYTNSDNVEGGTTYIKDDNTLIMEIGGVYFELVRTS